MEPIVQSADEAAALLAPAVSGAAPGSIGVLHLDGSRRLIAIASYPPNEAGTLPVREVVSEALHLGAEALVIGEDRPGGHGAPTAAQIAATRDLAETARRVGIILADHLIFADGDCRSMRKLGLL